MSESAAPDDMDESDAATGDRADPKESGAEGRGHEEKVGQHDSRDETVDSDESERAVTIDATYPNRDRRGVVKSVFISVTNASKLYYNDRGDIGKARKRAEILREVRRRGLAVDEQALEQALMALAQKFNSTDGPAGSGTATARTESVNSTPYFRESGGLYLRTLDGPVQLTNFDATITGDVLEDDGSGAPRRSYEITAIVPGTPSSAFEVPDDEFTSMGWVPRHLGPSAVVYAGAWIRDHARTAIQELSPKPIPRRLVYTHLGVRVVDGARLFLHAGGALSANGVVSDINVRLPEALARYDLPAPPSGAALATAVRASLGVLGVRPTRVMVPLLASVYRAPLGLTPFSDYVYGKTEAFKTARVALIQQHFGAGMDENGLPGSWSSTGNANEALAFHGKDVLLCLDDFVLTGSMQDAARKHGEADRVLRAQANQRGRQRLGSDQSLRRVMYPRGLIVATGEELPRGQSLRNRTCTLECKADEIDVDQLTECQELAGRGEYAKAMSGYIVWMLGHYDALHDGRVGVLTSLRDWAASQGLGRRTATVIAELTWGWLALLCFAQDVGVGEEEIGVFTSVGLEALIEAGGRQRHLQAESDPVSRFFDLVNAALASGRAHVAGLRGESPDGPEAWGWRGLPSHGDPAWMPQGERIGWLDGPHLYLEPEAALAVAQRVAHDGGDSLLIASRTLHRRLHERGLLVTVEEKRGVLTVRRTVEARRRDVLHLHVDALGLSDSPPNTAAGDNRPPWEPPSSEDDSDTGLEDDRDVLGELARSLDYPIMQLGSGQCVLPGGRSWQKFIAAAGATALSDARERLERLARRHTPRPGSR